MHRGPGAQQPHPQRHLSGQVERQPGHRRDPLRRRSCLGDLGDRQLPAHLGGVQDLLAGLRRPPRGTPCAAPHAARPRRPAPRPARRCPDPRSAAAPPGCCRSADGPSSWARNHTRCCANDNGTRSGRGRGPSAARAGPACSIKAASPAGAGASNTARTASSAPSITRILLTSRIASSECPPKAKKSSSGPTSSKPSTCANAAHTISSRTVAGLRPPDRGGGVVGGGQRLPVDLPVPGQRQRIQHHHRRRHHIVRQPRSGERAHHPRQLRATTARLRRGPHRQPAADRQGCPLAPRPRPGPPPGRRPAPPRPHPAQPGTRGPSPDHRPGRRTPDSRRAVHRARSPVRYIRSPARPERARHKPLPRQPRPPQIPTRQLNPRHIQLPRHPRRHRAQPLIQHYTRTFGNGRPIGTTPPASTSASSRAVTTPPSTPSARND